MNSIIETLLEYEWTEYTVHRMIRVVDQHVSTKKWLPQIVIKSWYTDDKIKAEKTYVGGKLNGPYTSWYKNRQLSNKSIFLNGVRHGLLHSWWSNGNLYIECTYIHGKLHGLYKIWYPSGKKCDVYKARGRA